jgi:hypothetical protein
MMDSTCACAIGVVARFPMNRALERAWSLTCAASGTCTFDHPSAVAFYQRSGFIPLRRRHL